MSTNRIGDVGPYIPNVKDVYVFKLVSGEEIIALMHPSEKVKNNEFDPFLKLENPLVFVQTSEGFNANDWCPWSPDRIFVLPVQSALIAQEAQPHMAEMYFAEKFPQDVNNSANDDEPLIQLLGQPAGDEGKTILTKDADVLDFRPK